MTMATFCGITHYNWLICNPNFVVVMMPAQNCNISFVLQVYFGLRLNKKC